MRSASSSQNSFLYRHMFRAFGATLGEPLNKHRLSIRVFYTIDKDEGDVKDIDFSVGRQRSDRHAAHEIPGKSEPLQISCCRIWPQIAPSDSHCSATKIGIMP